MDYNWKRSRSRSRSVTPVRDQGPLAPRPALLARRHLIMNAAALQCSDVHCEAAPTLWVPPLPPPPKSRRLVSPLPRPLSPLTAYSVKRTAENKLFVSEPVHVTKTPRGSIKRKRVLEQSIHVSAMELADAVDLDEEEGEAAIETDTGMEHVRKWVTELPPLYSPKDLSFLQSAPVSEAECDDVGTIRDQDLQPGTSGGQKSSHIVEHLDAGPSTSATVAESGKSTGPLVPYGSEYDSDYDDLYNPESLNTAGEMVRDIPDDNELEEPVRDLLHSIETAMDDAIENLVNVSTDFLWQENFDTFGGVPETFSGPTPGAVKDYDTPYEAFIDIWNKDFMEHIVRETNRYARQVIDAKIAAGTLKPSSRLHWWVPTDVDEMYVLFAIFIFMGLDPRTTQHDFWKSNSYLEMPKFRSLMSYSRYILLSKFLHFQDNADDSQDLPSIGGVMLSAKLRKVAPVLVHLNKKFEDLYHLNTDIAIDESLTLFKGRLSWVQAIRSKAARFGIKSYELCESRTGYMYRFDIYTGKNSERGDIVAPSAALAGKSAQVVLDLLKGLERRGHCVTMDNFYNCPALARYLKSLGFDCIGTLRVNRKHVPKEIAKAPKNVRKGTIIALHSGDVSCISWKDTKMVNLISTYHVNETYIGRKAGRDLVKPVVVKDYNNTMGGIDLKDQKLSMYLMERKRCLKWYMKIFKRLLNVSVHNSWILLLSSLKRRDIPQLTHRMFREKLANSLVEKHNHLPPQQNVPVVDLAMRLRRDVVHCPKYYKHEQRMYCHICRRNGLRKYTHLKCVTCDEPMCFEDCWATWHSAKELPGRHFYVRKTARRQ